MAEHVCDPTTLLNLQALAQDPDTKSCPECNTLISRTAGCAQMWCVNCNTAFDWTRMTVIRNVSGRSYHNPHHDAYMAKLRSQLGTTGVGCCAGGGGGVAAVGAGGGQVILTRDNIASQIIDVINVFVVRNYLFRISAINLTYYFPCATSAAAPPSAAARLIRAVMQITAPPQQPQPPSSSTTSTTTSPVTAATITIDYDRLMDKKHFTDLRHLTSTCSEIWNPFVVETMATVMGFPLDSEIYRYDINGSGNEHRMAITLNRHPMLRGVFLRILEIRNPALVVHLALLRQYTCDTYARIMCAFVFEEVNRRFARWMKQSQSSSSSTSSSSSSSYRIVCATNHRFEYKPPHMQQMARRIDALVKRRLLCGVAERRRQEVAEAEYHRRIHSGTWRTLAKRVMEAKQVRESQETELRTKYKPQLDLQKTERDLRVAYLLQRIDEKKLHDESVKVDKKMEKNRRVLALLDLYFDGFQEILVAFHSHLVQHLGSAAEAAASASSSPLPSFEILKQIPQLSKTVNEQFKVLKAHFNGNVMPANYCTFLESDFFPEGDDVPPLLPPPAKRMRTSDTASTTWSWRDELTSEQRLQHLNRIDKSVAHMVHTRVAQGTWIGSPVDLQQFGENNRVKIEAFCLYSASSLQEYEDPEQINRKIKAMYTLVSGGDTATAAPAATAAAVVAADD